MAAPTRSQIESEVTQPTYTVEYWNGSAWVAIGDQYVLLVSGDFTADDGGAAPLGFGASVGATGQLVLTSDGPTFTWQRTPIRARYGFESSDQAAGLYGVAVAKRDEPGATTYDLAGLDVYISGQVLYSPMLVGRTAATATNAASVEDPTAGNYQAGIINWILWNCGGRPYEQVASYPSATFYYTCQSAVMGPKYAWIAGDDPWQELARLCTSCGGQLYQRPDGVIAYVNPLTLGGSASYTLDVEKCSAEADTRDLITQVTVKYTTRAAQPFGLVYEDTTPRLVKSGETLSFTVSPDTPVIEWYTTDGTTVHTEHTYILNYLGERVTSGVAVTMTEQLAGKATLEFVNTSGTHLIVSRLTLYGVALAVVGEGETTIGSDSAQSNYDGVNVQDLTHARRIGTMIVDFYETVRTRRNVPGIGYDPDRVVGEVITLACNQPSVNAAHRINAIKPTNAGAAMDVDLVDVSGLPVLADFFLVDTTYSGATTKKWGY